MDPLVSTIVRSNSMRVLLLIRILRNRKDLRRRELASYPSPKPFDTSGHQRGKMLPMPTSSPTIRPLAQRFLQIYIIYLGSIRKQFEHDLHPRFPGRNKKNKKKRRGGGYKEDHRDD